MTYPPHLPIVLFSALNPIEGNPGRRPRRSLRTQTSHGRGRLHPRRRVLISLVGAIALAVVVVLGVRLGDGEEGATGSLGRQLGSAAGSVLPLPPFTETASAHARSSARLAAHCPRYCKTAGERPLLSQKGPLALPTRDQIRDRQVSGTSLRLRARLEGLGGSPLGS